MPDNDAVVAAPVAAPVTPVDAPKDVMSTSTIPVDAPAVVDAPKPTEPVVDAVVDPAVPSGDKTVPKDAPKWFQERFNEMTKTNRTLEREKAALIEQNAQVIAQLAAAKTGTAAPINPAVEVPKPILPVAPQDIDAMVNARAAEIARISKFNNECDKIAENGKKEFADFDNAVGILNQVGLIDAPDKPQTFLDVATTLDNPHKIMHYLGSNPDEAARLRHMEPVRLAQELTRLEYKLNQPKPVSVSNAPAPIKTISGVAKGETDIYDKNIPMDEWVEARRKQRAAKYASRRR